MRLTHALYSLSAVFLVLTGINQYRVWEAQKRIDEIRNRAKPPEFSSVSLEAAATPVLTIPELTKQHEATIIPAEHMEVLFLGGHWDCRLIGEKETECKRANRGAKD